jgi:ABC-type multidrug transport system fused ATPase/permease subunit
MFRLRQEVQAKLSRLPPSYFDGRQRGEVLSTHALVKVFGRQAEAARAFDEQNEQLYQASFRGQFMSGSMMPLMMLLQSGAASAERIFAVLDAGEQRPDRPDAVEPRTATGRVVFDHVAFSYAKDKSRTASSAPPRTRSCGPPRRPTSTISCGPCRMGTRRS